MIPTAVTSSSASTTLSVLSVSAPMSPSPSSSASSTSTAACYSGQQQQNQNSMIIGIASLILEGRAVGDVEYQPIIQAALRSQLDNSDTTWQRESVGNVSSSLFNTTTEINLTGRQSPKPSTSKAAAHIINITTNPQVTHQASLIESFANNQQYNVTDTGHQRWTQKICQLRQSSPAGSFFGNTHERKYAIETQSGAVEPELVSLAINDESMAAEHGDFEILRSVHLNRSNISGVVDINSFHASSSSSSNYAASDNFLHSLQSLATTCLRGGGGNGGAAASPPPSAQLVTHNSNKCSYRSLTPRFSTPYNLEFGIGAASSSNLQSPPNVDAISKKEKMLLQTTSSNRIATTTSYESSAAASALKTRSKQKQKLPTSTKLQQGPHCEQFLRKMGLTKSLGDGAEFEEHFCDMSLVNLTCSRWRAYCQKIETIIERRESVCIEVYLGPVNNKILLEQWIITQREKLPPPTMTLPSLCSAIRSQLYFSQISAWLDLIKKSDKSIYETGRVILYSGPTGAAGDLASSTSANAANLHNSLNSSPIGGNSSPPSSSSPLYQTSTTCCTQSRPRLNIFYRIKRYDETACFNSMPNIHNFPNVNINENCSISVCLKSLPRLNGGIPKIINNPKVATTVNTTTGVSAREQSNINSYMSKRTATMQRQQQETLPRPSRNTITNSNRCDIARMDKTINLLNNKPTTSTAIDNIKSRYVIADDQDDNDNDETQRLNNGAIISANLSHREKQLLKYRKRMLKRDKKQREKFCSSPTDSTKVQQQHTSTSVCVASAGDSVFNRRNSQHNIQMISTGTQTSMTCCQQCGSEKQLICLKCNNNNNNNSKSRQQQSAILNDEEDSMDDNSSSSDIIRTPRNQAEMLLAAIQRTPKAAAKKHKKQLIAANNNSASTSSISSFNSAIINSNGGCQVCKRQKTQHNFSVEAIEDEVIMHNESQYLAEPTTLDAFAEKSIIVEGQDIHENSIKNVQQKPTELLELDQQSDVEEVEIFESEIFSSITRVFQPTIKIGSNKRLHTPSPPASNIIGVDVITNEHEDKLQIQFKTPTSSAIIPIGVGITAKINDKQTPKPNLLQICSNYPTIATTIKMNLPKVNLTPIFCNGTPITDIISPVGIDSHTFDFDLPTVLDANIPVQKSYSAPTLPHSSTSPHSSSPSTLSPRFAKQAAIYKKRSRHLSDRSDRSSLGSDEPLSDDELIEYSPATSPLKQRAIGEKISAFARAPLLGNLEEALLQRRLRPKVEVMGFKILLGASGGFCPKQLSIPAMAYFYELQGESLSTPYVCEIRLPRKGYSVPRTGTVQVTLLNPAGTVVRMFVVPYDMRDMPPLQQTFIRQRILADVAGGNSMTSDTILLDNIKYNSSINNNNGDSVLNDFNCAYKNINKNDEFNKHSTTKGKSEDSGDGRSKLGHFLSAEHMKRLRYSIHLRFQTSRSGRLSLHTDIRLLISRRTDCDTAAAHAKGVLEVPSDLITDTVMPSCPKYSARTENVSKI